VTETPRVAYFPDSFEEINGVAHTSRLLVAYAVRQDCPVLVVHAGSRTRVSRVSRAVTRVELERGRMSFGLERDLRFDLGLWRHTKAVRAEIEAFAPDLIHVTGPNDVGQLGAYLAHEMGIPLVASWHTNLHDFAARRLDRLAGSLPAWLRRRLVARAQGYSLRLLLDFYRLGRVVLAPNRELTSLLGHATQQSVHLMERGVDTSLFHPDKRHRSDRIFRIGFVGRLSPEKNVRALADIEAVLLRQGLGDFRFVVVGDGRERAWLASHLQHADLPGLLSGDTLAAAYANLDAFVFPSETDTYGNVVLEALAAAVPAIVTARGGPKFLVQDGVTGFVCDDVPAMARAVGTLMTDPSLVASMRTAARRRALDASWDRVFERLYEAYASAAFARGGSGVPRQYASRDLTVVARAVRGVFRLLTWRPSSHGPLAPSAGSAVTP
jgi:glycosyltransferase involved in cell wall biosynthesis